MGKPRREAVRLAQWYFRPIAQRAGIAWDSDTGTGLLACCVTGATRAAAHPDAHRD